MSAPQRPTKATVEEAIRNAGGNLSKAAILLGISRQTLYTYVYKFDLARLAGVNLAVGNPAAKPAGPEPVPVNVHLPGATWRWVRIFAIQTDRTASAVVLEALTLYRSLVESKS